MTYQFCLDRVDQVAQRIAPHVIRTPVLPWYGPPPPELADTDIFIKLELLQRTGSFKARAALNSLMMADDLSNGVAAFSAGNHAIAVAWAARKLGTSATVVMPRSANAFRVNACRSLGAEIVFADGMADLMERVDRLCEVEHRLLIHPFEGEHVVDGTATLGREISDDVAELDALIVPVGGGGLIAGVASALQYLKPACEVFGVEPEGACGMQASLAAGYPLPKVEVNSIADSLSAPLHQPLSFSVVQAAVKEIVLVSDDDMKNAMRRVFAELKLAVEPACAASFAALLGPLRERLTGRRVGVVACGSNLDYTTFQDLVK